MQDNVAKTDMNQGAGLVAGASEHLGVEIHQRYKVECWRAGVLIWEDEYENLVVTAGRNKYLDATLKTGLASPTWYVGLITGPGAGNTYAAGDTMASHAGWAESAAYSNANRPTWTPGSVSGGSVDNSAAKAVFNINATATIAGSFMVDNNTISGSSGTLLGEGNFTAGDRLVQSGDTLNVTVTCSLS